MIFAEAVDSNSTATGASMIACAMAALSGLFAWLSRRDQLRSDRETARDKIEHDTRIIQQDAEIESLKHQHAECEANHAKLERVVDELRKRIDDMTGQYRPLPPAAA